MKEDFGGNTVVCFTNDLWSGALIEIRLKAPLEESGFQVVQGNAFDRLLVEDLSSDGVVLIQRDFPMYLDSFFHVLQQVRLKKLPLVYEIDDNLFQLPEDHPDQLSGYYGRRYIPMLWAICSADLVTVSTEAIADFLRPFNKNVHVLKNYLVDKYWRFSPVKQNQRERVVIGFIGGATHAADLEMISESLRMVGQQFEPKVRFKFWGALPPEAFAGRPEVDWQPVTGSYQDYAAEFPTQDIDILVAPLMDTPFSQSKSHLKFLEYSTLGVPAVYSNVTPFQQVVKHGENGFLASSPEEWVGCLQSLISSADLRSSMARAAQESVKQDWLLSRNAYQWADRYGSLQADAKAGQEKTADLRETRDMELYKILSTQSGQIERLLQKERILAEWEQRLQETVQAYEKGLAERDQALQTLLGSPSWRITHPLRVLANRLDQIKRKVFQRQDD